MPGLYFCSSDNTITEGFVRCLKDSVLVTSRGRYLLGILLDTDLL